MSIADEVFRLRKEAGLTQYQLAAKAGITDRTLRYIEHGSPPKIATLRRLADALEVPLRDLLGTENTEATA